MATKYPYLSRVVTRPGWRHEWWQYDGHYIVKTWSVAPGGTLHFDGAERHEGKAPTEAKERKAKPVQVEPEYSAERQFALKRAIKRRLEDRRQGRAK